MSLRNRWRRSGGASWFLQAADGWNWALLREVGPGSDTWHVDVWRLRARPARSIGEWELVGTVRTLRAAKAIGRINAAMELASRQNF
ncbi:MAG: hypothetical protein ACKO0Z_01820 [Betaproteobacteria bacterium]